MRSSLTDFWNVDYSGEPATWNSQQLEMWLLAEREGFTSGTG